MQLEQFTHTRTHARTDTQTHTQTQTHTLVPEPTNGSQTSMPDDTLAMLAIIMDSVGSMDVLPSHIYTTTNNTTIIK